MALHLGLIIQEEKCLVLVDRATQRSAKLVQIELLRRLSEVLIGIELGVAEELKQRSVPLVRSGLGRHQNSGPGALTVFSRVFIGEDLEFLDVVDRREDRDTAFIQLVVIVAVEQPVGLLFA